MGATMFCAHGASSASRLKKGVSRLPSKSDGENNKVLMFWWSQG
jgi:hypothetical protein